VNNGELLLGYEVKDAKPTSYNIASKTRCVWV